MMAFAAFVLSFAGFTMLALSQSKHYRDLFGTALLPLRKRMLRTGGSVLLIASLAPAIADLGIAPGLVLWLGIVTVAALATAMLLTYRNLWRRV